MTAAARRSATGPASGRVPALRICIAALLLGFPAAASEGGWTVEKCSRYASAWSAARERQGTAGLSPAFLDAHDRFIASGCRTRGVCPRSQAEIGMADLMTVLALNAGMSGTFLPFMCRS